MTLSKNSIRRATRKHLLVAGAKAVAVLAAARATRADVKNFMLIIFNLVKKGKWIRFVRTRI